MNKLFRSISVIIAISFAIINFIHYHQDLDLVIPFYAQITSMVSLVLLVFLCSDWFGVGELCAIKKQ